MAGVVVLTSVMINETHPIGITPKIRRGNGNAYRSRGIFRTDCCLSGLLTREEQHMGPRRNKLTRLALSGLAVVAVLVCTCIGTVARAETVLRVGKANDIAFTFIPLDVGIHEKLFQKNGVKVEPFVFAGSAKLHQAMVAGSIDIALGAGTDIPFLMKGAPEIGVGAIAVTPALFGLVIRYNSPIHSLAGLKGKKIGVSTVGSLTQWIALQVIKKEHWQPKDLTIVYTGGSSAAEIAALRTHEIDAIVSATALGWNLELHKAGRLLMPVSDFIGPFLLNVIYASDNVVRHHPHAVRGFLKGWYEAVAFMANHKAQAVAIARKVTHFSKSVQDKQYNGVMPSMSRHGTFPPAATAAVARSFVELHLLAKEPDMSKYLTTRFLARP